MRINWSSFCINRLYCFPDSINNQLQIILTENPTVSFQIIKINDVIKIKLSPESASLRHSFTHFLVKKLRLTFIKISVLLRLRNSFIISRASRFPWAGAHWCRKSSNGNKKDNVRQYFFHRQMLVSDYMLNWISAYKTLLKSK